MDTDIQLEILQLDKLKTLCDELIVLDRIKKSNDEVLSLLKTNYKLSEDDLKKVKDIINGKRILNEKDQKRFDETNEEFTAYCKVTHIDEKLDYKKIKARIANKLSKLKKASNEPTTEK